MAWDMLVQQVSDGATIRAYYASLIAPLFLPKHELITEHRYGLGMDGGHDWYSVCRRLNGRALQ